MTLFATLTLVTTVATAQMAPVPAVKYAATITPGELKTHLDTLASDAFEGRETGTEGQRAAAAYIQQVFKDYGLPPVVGNTYYQKIAFTGEGWTSMLLELQGETIRHLWDYYSYPAYNQDRDAKTFKEVVFLGYGIDSENYSDYDKVDVKGKAILIYAGEPTDAKGNSQVTGTAQPSTWSKGIARKLRLAHQKGVSLVLVIDGDFRRNAAKARKKILNSSLELGEGEQTDGTYANNVFLSSKTAEVLMGDRYKKIIKARNKMQQKGKSKPVTIPTNLRIVQRKYKRQILGENVLGYIEGTDPAKKDELIVITGHYDHLGQRGDAIYNGADDNASGTSTVLEIAEAFALARADGVGPKRSVLCMLVSGEEKGLLGSEYYVKNPLFPLENTVANINIDMVGRTDQKHADNPNYIYVIGADRLSTALHEINERVNNDYVGLELDYTYNAESDPNRYYYRSDHYNFAERGIPAVFYFNGTHADYHRSTDTAEKIQFDKMANIGRLAFHTAWELANREERIQVDVKE